MAVNYTALLGLAQPVDGTEAGTWGDDINNGLTALVDTAIAGAQTFSANATLTTTQGAANTFRQAIIIVSGTSGAITLTAPAGKTKSYIILNESAYNCTITSGGTPAVVAPSAYALVATDGTNYYTIASTGGAVVQYVTKDSSTGSAALPVGNTSQRTASPTSGLLRFNNQTNAFEGYGASSWGSIGGGGATGGGNDLAFYENDVYITTNYTLGQGAQQPATVTIAAPAVVTQANNFVAGQPVRFTTTGALPTGLNTSGVFYVASAGLTTASFQVAATSGGASVTTTGTQSGNHTVGKMKDASMTGPITVGTGVSVTVPSGSRLVVL